MMKRNERAAREAHVSATVEMALGLLGGLRSGLSVLTNLSSLSENTTKEKDLIILLSGEYMHIGLFIIVETVRVFKNQQIRNDAANFGGADACCCNLTSRSASMTEFLRCGSRYVSFLTSIVSIILLSFLNSSEKDGFFLYAMTCYISSLFFQQLLQRWE